MNQFVVFMSPTKLYKINNKRFRLFANLEDKYANVEKIYCYLEGNKQIEAKVTRLLNGQLVAEVPYSHPSHYANRMIVFSLVPVPPISSR